jgi:hypothetical protein
MRILVDTNVLVRLVHLSNPQQPIAANALRRLHEQSWQSESAEHWQNTEGEERFSSVCAVLLTYIPHVLSESIHHVSRDRSLHGVCLPLIGAGMIGIIVAP